MFYFGEKELNAFLERSLSKREREIFLAVSVYQGKTFSSVVKIMSNKYPESTTKTIVRRRKEFQLLECGNKDNTNIPLVLTDFGSKVLDIPGSNNKNSENKKR